MDTFNVTPVMLAAGAFNLACLELLPYLYRRVLWGPYRKRYEEFPFRGRLDFTGRFPQTILGLLSTYLAAWTYLYDPSFSWHTFHGGTKWGNVALDITIGQFTSDFLYEVVLYRRKPKLKHVLHHVASILGAGLAHRYFHAWALYRYIHDLALPLVGIFAQMGNLKVDIHSIWYKVVAIPNVIVFTTLRGLVVPFHCWWMVQAWINSPNQPHVPIPVIITFAVFSITLDIINCGWSIQIAKIFYKNVRKWQEA